MQSWCLGIDSEQIFPKSPAGQGQELWASKKGFDLQLALVKQGLSLKSDISKSLLLLMAWDA